LAANDPDMNAGWKMIPIPPIPDADWFIIDTGHDSKTDWARIEWS
jgi:hypothetical protein